MTPFLRVLFLKIFLQLNFSVKYLREVTPYFRKSSPLMELGWGTQDSAHKDVGSASGGGSGGNNKIGWSETKTLPLKLCYLCRNLTMPDAERRTLELHAPDGKGVCTLRMPDPATASDWFNALHSNVMMLTRQSVEDANAVLASAPNQHQIRHMGWLSEQVSQVWLSFDYSEKYDRVCEFLFNSSSVNRKDLF